LSVQGFWCPAIDIVQQHLVEAAHLFGGAVKIRRGNDGAVEAGVVVVICTAVSGCVPSTLRGPSQASRTGRAGGGVDCYPRLVALGKAEAKIAHPIGLLIWQLQVLLRVEPVVALMKPLKINPLVSVW
jgi:hypothetical protein